MLRFAAILVFLVLVRIPLSWGTTPLLAVTEHHPPYQVADDDYIRGIATERVRKILKQAELTAEFSMMNWARAYHLALNKPNILIYSMLRTPDREAKFHWITPVAELQAALISLKSSKLQAVTTLEQAKAYRLAVIRDAYSHKLLLRKGFVENHNIYLVADLIRELKLLKSGRIDFVLTDPNTVRHEMRILGYSEDEIHINFWLDGSVKKLYLATSLKTSQVIVDKLKRAAKAN